MNGKYTLYSGELQSLPESVKYSYYDPCKKRLLIYSSRRYKGFHKIDESGLVSEEKSWLFKTKSRINREYIKEHQDVIAPLLAEFLEKFEKELRSEAEKTKTTTAEET